MDDQYRAGLRQASEVFVRRMCAVVLLFVAVMTAEALASSGEAHAGASTPVCAPPNTPLAGVFLELYRLAVVSDSDEVWTETRSQLRLTGTLDSTLVVLESDDSTCAAALKVYRRHFRAGEGAQVLVAKIDTLRAIARVDPVAESDTTSIQVGLTIHLITNADFSAVIDTIWY